MDDGYIGLTQAMMMLDRSRVSVYRMVKKGLLRPYYKPSKPREILFRVEDVKSLTVPKSGVDDDFAF